MEIQLLPPFIPKWHKGYLQVHANGRKYLCLFNSNSDRTIISYARYLMSVHLGYEIPEGYEVDHKNNDCTDDRIDNYQILTTEQNRLKQKWWQDAMVTSWTLVPCDNCGGLFYITQRRINMKIAQGVEHMCCSKSCSAAFQHKLKKLNC